MVDTVFGGDGGATFLGLQAPGARFRGLARGRGQEKERSRILGALRRRAKTGELLEGDLALAQRIREAGQTERQRSLALEAEESISRRLKSRQIFKQLEPLEAQREQLKEQLLDALRRAVPDVGEPSPEARQEVTAIQQQQQALQQQITATGRELPARGVPGFPERPEDVADVLARRVEALTQRGFSREQAERLAVQVPAERERRAERLEVRELAQREIKAGRAFTIQRDQEQFERSLGKLNIAALADKQRALFNRRTQERILEKTQAGQRRRDTERREAILEQQEKTAAKEFKERGQEAQFKLSQLRLKFAWDIADLTRKAKGEAVLSFRLRKEIRAADNNNAAITLASPSWRKKSITEKINSVDRALVGGVMSPGEALVIINGTKGMGLAHIQQSYNRAVVELAKAVGPTGGPEAYGDLRRAIQAEFRFQESLIQRVIREPR